MEIVIVPEVCAFAHSPASNRSTGRESRFIDDTMNYIGTSTRQL